MTGAEDAFTGTLRFEVRGRIGDGGGGVVYRAYDRKLDRDVALKLMRDTEGDGMTRFRAGFGALKHLAHPNLVQLYDLFDEGGRVILVMELVEGVELLEYVRKPEGGFDELRLRDAFSQLAQALRALHHERKVHRDVKPSNVRVTVEGRVVLLDLDLATDIDADNVQSPVDVDARPVGTAVYMAPELVASLEVRPSSDWYSMGVVLYEALTDTLPYRGSDLEVLLAKQDTRPVLPSELAQNVPVDLERLCVDLLASNPSERPRGAQVLRRLGVHEEVVSGRLSVASMLSARPPFIGRERELSRLSSALERSRGGPVIVRVVGEIGVGKTMLCEEFVRRLAHDPAGALVLSSACPRFPDVPHAPLHDPIARVTEALRQGKPSVKLPVSASSLRLLERAFPASVLGLEARTQGRTAIAPDPLEQRWRAIAALRLIVSEVATARPLVLWIDDYHWADIDTQRLITSLTTGPDAPRMLVVLSEDYGAGEGQAFQPAAHESIELARLTPLEARELANHLLERATGAGVDEESVFVRGGLPFLVQERLRYALFFGEPPDEHASLEQLFARRVAELSPSALRVLEIVCAAHDPVPQDVCERASELSRADFSRQLSALRVGAFVRGVVVAGEDYLVPHHPLVAECMDVHLQGEARRIIHSRLSVALVARDPARASGRLLRHQGESGDHLAAAQSARVAAEQAHEALAFQRAAELFTLCASLDPPAEDEAGHLMLRRMAESLAHAGWALPAATVYREAARGAKVADALHMRQRAAEHLIRGAEVDQGFDAVRELLGSIDMKLPRHPASVFLSAATRRVIIGVRGLRFQEATEGQISARDLRRIDVLWTSGMQISLVDIMRGGDLLARSLLDSLKAGEPHRVARALCTEAWTMIGIDRADFRRTNEVLDAAGALIERLGSPLLDGHLRLTQGMIAFATYRLPECSAHCRDAERVFRDNCSDVVWEVTTAQIHHLIALAHMARYEEMAPKLELSLREAEERGDVWGHTYLLSIGALSVKLARNLPDEAAEDVKKAMARWTRNNEFHLQHLFGLVASVYVDLYRGKKSALDTLRMHWPELKSRLLLRIRVIRTIMYELRGRAHVLASVKTRDSSLLRAAEIDAHTLMKKHDPAAKGFGHLLRANVHKCRGELDAAIDELKRGIPLLETRGVDMWVPASRAVLADLIGGQEGRELRQKALSVLDARGVVDKARFIAMMMPAFGERD